MYIYAAVNISEGGGKMKKHRLAGAAAALIMAFSGTVFCPTGEAPFSAAAEAASKLPAAENITADVSGNTVKLKWDKVKGADAYRVFRYNAKTKKYESFRTCTKNNTSVKGLADGTYRFRVAALVKKNGKYSAQAKSAPITAIISAKEKTMTERITVNTQSSIRIDCDDLIIRIDPFKIDGEPHDADIVLITHAHYDHFSPDDIAKVSKPDTVIAAPETMKKELAKEGINKPVLLKPDEKTTILGIPIETVRAYNQAKAFHPRSNDWLGYIVTALGKRIYAAGDTDAVPEAKAVKCDIALVPIGGTYTMDAKEAAALINEIKPGTAIPIHYGSIVGSRSDGSRFAKLVDSGITVEIK